MVTEAEKSKRRKARAAFHVHKAYCSDRECIGFPRGPSAADIGRLQRKIVRAAPVQDWTTLHTLILLNLAEEAVELAKWLFERYDVQPEHLLLCARASEILTRKRPPLKPETTAAYEEALAAAATQNEPIIHRLQVLPHYANFLARHGDDTEKQHAKQMDREIDKLLKSAPLRTIPAQWFERLGDEAESPSDASQLAHTNQVASMKRSPAMNLRPRLHRSGKALFVRPAFLKFIPPHHHRNQAKLRRPVERNLTKQRILTSTHFDP